MLRCSIVRASRSAAASFAAVAVILSLSATSPAPASQGLTIAEARRYLVALINRDRAGARLPPVVLDEGAPTVAGQRHAEDMAKSGFVGHWGTDGSVPEERYTEAGGVDFVMENSSCVNDGRRRSLDPKPRIDPRDLERAERMFMDEKPPLDGHRRNILSPRHRRVGIGVAQVMTTQACPTCPIEIPTPCLAQEFVDPYGTYAPLPARAKVGQRLTVAGRVLAPARFTGVGLGRVDRPRPLAVVELLKRFSYPIPPPYQMYWPRPYVSPIPVTVEGDRFSVEVPLSHRGQPGLYEVTVWVRFPGDPDPAMVSLRTIRVER
jgi:uncharacterized protein YkwD